ncbi:MAG: 2-dehydropantoate 2-reductase, partial [Bacteroidia bacterium]|nr:2-dehydropantoate 2-reductase [Bacteroidia bacterium]
MNIVVIGAGGVGGFFGGKLAKAGFDVTFVVRGANKKTIDANGLQIKSIDGDFKIYPKTIESVFEIDQVDLILLAVKSWQIEAIAKQSKSVISENTMVLPLQNGADNADRLRAILPKRNVLAGLCKIVSKIESPGVISHFEYEPQIIFGEYDNSKTKRMQQLKTVFDKAGFKSIHAENIQLEIWKKFLFIASVSGLGAITRSVFGVMRANENLRELLYQTAQEIKAIANAKQIPLDEKHIEGAIAIVDRMNYNTTASMQRDIMEGKPSELQNFNGYIVEQGKLLGISTPVNAFTFYCLLPQERKARKQ